MSKLSMSEELARLSSKDKRPLPIPINRSKFISHCQCREGMTYAQAAAVFERKQRRLWYEATS